MNSKPKISHATTSSNPPTAPYELRLVLSVPDFGDRYGLKKTTVYKWIGLGMPHLKLSQRKTRVPLKEADQWVKENFYRQNEL